MGKQVLFVYGNRPQALVVSMIRLLAETGQYEPRLLYLDRERSNVQIPMPGGLSKELCLPETCPTGNGFVTKVLNGPIVLTRLAKRMRGLRPDVIHAWNLNILLAARLAARRLPGTKIVFTLQDTTEWMRSGWSRALQRWAYRGVDLFFVTSEQFDSRFLRRFNLVPGSAKVVFVPNVPPAAMFADFKPRVATGGLVIGYFGFFRGKEGIGTLVEAVRMVRSLGGDHRVLFAGIGVEVEFVKRLARENDWVKFLGPYHHEQTVDLYRRTDLLYAVYDRSYDKQIHLAYRLCEAINCRLPIIVAKGTHMSEVVEAHRVGVSVTLGDATELAATLGELYRSPERRAEIARNCENVRRRFVFEYYQDKILDAYRGLWDGGVRPSE